MIDVTIEDWEESVMTKAYEEFNGLEPEFVEKQSIYQFRAGALDKEAAQFTLNSSPKTLEEAMQKKIHLLFMSLQRRSVTSNLRDEAQVKHQGVQRIISQTDEDHEKDKTVLIIGGNVLDHQVPNPNEQVNKK